MIQVLLVFPIFVHKRSPSQDSSQQFQEDEQELFSSFFLLEFFVSSKFPSIDNE